MFNINNNNNNTGVSKQETLRWRLLASPGLAGNTVIYSIRLPGGAFSVTSYRRAVIL